LSPATIRIKEELSAHGELAASRHDLPGGPGSAFLPGSFDFAFFLLVLLPPAPFNPPHCHSTLNFPHSLQIT
jgi:hypothetical protein